MRPIDVTGEHSLGPTGCALVAVVAALVSACGGGVPTAASLGVEEISQPIGQCEVVDGATVRMDTVAVGLQVPWDVTFLEDGRALVTERPGTIRVISADGVLLDEPWAVFDVNAEAETGLLGIDHSYTPDGDLQVFVAGTVQDIGDSAGSRVMKALGRRVVRLFNSERGHANYLQVWRLEEQDGRGVRPTVIVEDLPTGLIHAGGALRIGPDGLLYVSSGEAGQPSLAQDASTTRGKILRYDLAGSVPSGNPDPGSPAYALGVRNVQGIDWHRDAGLMLAIDHGPSGLPQEGFRVNGDELNVVSPGSNHGWPIVSGTTTGGTLVSPIATWDATIAPAGLQVLHRPGSAWHGDAFVTGLRGVLERLEISGGVAGATVACVERVTTGGFGRLRMIRQAPDSTLWLGTSNRDQRGRPGPDSDLILRIHPPSEASQTVP